jgi:predicted SprT family Zn-dependent metalloprotease
MTTPTQEIFGALQAMFDHFNAELFDGELEQCVIVSQRKANTMGYFKPRNWGQEGGTQLTHEIAMNPAYFLVREKRDTASTMVHEMMHQLRFQQGEKSKGYHSKEWAEGMQVRGLMPSTTGAPGGKTTGYRVSHYVIDRGLFDLSFQRFTGKLTWGDVPTQGREQAKPKRLKFVCPACADNAMGKASLAIICEQCTRRMRHAEQEASDDQDLRLAANFGAGVGWLLQAFQQTERDDQEQFFATVLGCTLDELKGALIAVIDRRAETVVRAQEPDVGVSTPKRRGRPPGSKNKAKGVVGTQTPKAKVSVLTQKRGRGRPKGSKNRPKAIAA